MTGVVEEIQGLCISHCYLLAKWVFANAVQVLNRYPKTNRNC